MSQRRPSLFLASPSILLLRDGFFKNGKRNGCRFDLSKDVTHSDSSVVEDAHIRKIFLSPPPLPVTLYRQKVLSRFQKERWRLFRTYKTPSWMTTHKWRFRQKTKKGVICLIFEGALTPGEDRINDNRVSDRGQESIMDRVSYTG